MSGSRQVFTLVPPSCCGAGCQPCRSISSLEDAVADDQAFKFASVSPFGSLTLSFATLPAVSQEKAKPLLLHDHCLHILTNLVPFLWIFIQTCTASETSVIHPSIFVAHKHKASFGIGVCLRLTSLWIERV